MRLHHRLDYLLPISIIRWNGNTGFTVPLLAGGGVDNVITIVGLFFFIMVSKPSEYGWTFGSASNYMLVAGGGADNIDINDGSFAFALNNTPDWEWFFFGSAYCAPNKGT